MIYVIDWTIAIAWVIASVLVAGVFGWWMNPMEYGPHRDPSMGWKFFGGHMTVFTVLGLLFFLFAGDGPVVGEGY